ncbi:hypothetical protein Salat_1370400 [Sesamum alatum]|uniref:Uncharacterized protein n=1 Tax=Sesamum alatum TaxID=300844 RepID=A0AAE2CL76_9LAMI|nr:hypothetical protein Salat_1370400 [Sesamum alatum]
MRGPRKKNPRNMLELLDKEASRAFVGFTKFCTAFTGSPSFFQSEITTPTKHSPLNNNTNQHQATVLSCKTMYGCASDRPAKKEPKVPGSSSDVQYNRVAAADRNAAVEQGAAAESAVLQQQQENNMQIATAADLKQKFPRTVLPIHQRQE